MDGNDDFVAGEGSVAHGGGVAVGVAIGVGVAFFDEGAVGVLDADVENGEVVGGLDDDGVADLAAEGAEVDVADVGGVEVIGDGHGVGGLGVHIDTGGVGNFLGGVLLDGAAVEGGLLEALALGEHAGDGGLGRGAGASSTETEPLAFWWKTRPVTSPEMPWVRALVAFAILGEWGVR